MLDAASHGALDSEFGSHKDDDVVAQILEKGTVQQHEVRSFDKIMISVNGMDADRQPFLQEHGRSGDKNITQGPIVSH